MIDPTIPLQGAKPADPLDRYSKLMAIQSGQQQQQAAALQIQEQQRNLNAQTALDRVMSQAITTSPDGTPQFDAGAVTSGLAQSGFGHLIPQVTKSMTDLQSSATELRTKQLALKTATNDYTAQGLLAIKDGNYDPNVALGVVAHAVASGALPQAQAVQLTSQIQANPTPDGVRALIDPFIQQSPGVQKLLTERQTAGAAGIRADAAKKDADLNAEAAPGKNALTAAEVEQKQTQNASSQLATAADSGDPAAVARVMGSLSPAIAAKFAQAKTADDFRRIGMTPAEQATAKQAADVLANTKDYQANELGLSTQRNSIAQAEQNLRVKTFNATLGQGLDQNGQLVKGADGKPVVSPAAQMIADYEVGGPRVTAQLVKSPGLLAQVKTANPGFDAKNYDAAQSIRVAKGGNIQALNTAVVHVDQLRQAAEALENGTLVPGNRLLNNLIATFGGAAPTNFQGIKNAVAGEMATALKGNGTDVEIANISRTLDAAGSPEQLQKAVKTGLEILATKLNTYDEQYHQDVGANDPWHPQLPSATAVLRNNGVSLKPDTGAPAPKNPFRK